MKVVTVTLNPAIDKTVVVPNFRPERVVRVREVYLYPSGKGVNVARVLSRLGVKAVCLGFIGGYFGRFLADSLTREGIEHDFNIVSDETRINLTICDPQNGLEVHLVEPGAKVTEEDWLIFVSTYERHLENASWVALCGSLPPGVPIDAYAQLIRIAHRKSVPCALDTSGEALLKGVGAKPKLVKPNKQELAELVGEELKSEEKLRSAILKVHQLGVDIVVVSLGKEGAIGSDGTNFWKATTLPVKVVNTVGSGDALLGGLIFALLKEMSFEEALKFAVATGTANTLVDGPCYIDLRDLHEIWSLASVRKL
ncbi:MAG: 1-phosphofructokinase [Armatimonadetes bacterium]|nr:1-phosphofructokinase [Armatimonadota bacterium]MDW8027502.1 1-phosphofructokinase [Armatimonadota bacterium]